MRRYLACAMMVAAIMGGCDRERTRSPDMAAAATQPGQLSEEQKIEALIARVEQLKDAQFVRAGSEYSSANAAELMRYKWRQQREEIRTAQDFIDKAASRSKNTGQEYVIRFKDGRQVTSGEFLSAELEKLEARK